MFHARIREAYDKLSPSYQRLATFLLDRYHDAAFMSATQLAKACGLDAATAVRFAQVLGYRGYPELQAEIRDTVKAELGRDRADSAGPLPEAAVLHSLEGAVQQIQNAGQSLNLHRVADVLRLLDQAAEIMVVGEGEAARLADLLALQLRWLGLRAVSPALTLADLAPFAAGLDARRVIVAVASEPLSPDVAALVRLAHSRGAPVIALVGALSWEVARLAAYVLVAGEGEHTLAVLSALSSGLIAGLSRIRETAGDADGEARRALLAARMAQLSEYGEQDEK